MSCRLSLEEVVRQHQSGQQNATKQGMDASMRRIKAEHLKARGDEGIKQGNYRLALDRYSEAIELQPDRDCLPALHSNRSLAHFKAQRYSDALRDADLAARLAPSWHKGHWRRGAALAALKRQPDAVAAFHEAWRCATGEARRECDARLWQAVQRLTREQLGRGILAVMAALQEEGGLQAPKVEAASDLEQGEAMFRLLKAAHKLEPKPGPFYRRYLDWLQQGMHPTEAYMQRSALHTEARCYLQAQADAQAAIALLTQQLRQADEQLAAGSPTHAAAAAEPRPPDQCATQEGGSSSAQLQALQAKRDSTRFLLAGAFEGMGKACMAQLDHPDRDCRAAAKAFLRVTELDPGSTEVLERLGEASKELTVEQVEEIQVELYHEGTPGSKQALAASAIRGKRFRAVLRLGFPAAKAADCSFKAREQLRAGVAAAAGLEPRAVTIEQVLAPSAARQHLAVLLHVQLGPELLKASDLVKAVCGKAPSNSSCGPAGASASPDQHMGGQREGQPGVVGGQDAAAAAADGPAAEADLEQRRQRLAELLGGEAVTAALGPPDPALCSGEVQDVTPACEGASEAERAQQAALGSEDAAAAPADDRRLALPGRPKMELELPYRLYRLTRADGSLVERVDKHPFCMSRVYYDAIEKPEEVWTELLDGSCRWRQTGGEVKVLALQVPPDLPTRQLGVDIQPYSLKVWNRASGEAYLEGALERGVVPEDCFWTHCGGEGEDGCAIYLRKMNLEVLKNHWQHTEMWWPRLFKAHGEIAWDDYEKDYSDLPEEVLARHRVREAIQDDERRVENVERKKREALQEADDVRKRARQERLAELRSGKKMSWVELHRSLPSMPAS